ncbi:MAG: ferredoxin family protein [Deltaproteobacteria bacterium]|nr:ferredoxin family protein [Deltaproteobacteria bacterium]
MPMRIDYHRCKGCKSCYSNCPGDVIGWDKERMIPYLAYPNECWHCGVCRMECPENAIELTLPPQCLSETNRRFLSLPAGTVLRRENIGMV